MARVRKTDQRTQISVVDEENGRLGKISLLMKKIMPLKIMRNRTRSLFQMCYDAIYKVSFASKPKM